MDKRTVLLLAILVAGLVVGFSFLIFSPSAHKAMQQNLESTVEESTTQP